MKTFLTVWLNYLVNYLDFNFTQFNFDYVFYFLTKYKS